jgi:hypothetical protein
MNNYYLTRSNAEHRWRCVIRPFANAGYSGNLAQGLGKKLNAK